MRFRLEEEAELNVEFDDGMVECERQKYKKGFGIE